MKRHSTYRMKPWFLCRLLLPVLLSTAAVSAIAGATETGQEVTGRERTLIMQYLQAPALVKGGRVKANWLEDGTTFWFRDSEGLHLVDPAKQKIRPLTPEERSGLKEKEQPKRSDRVSSPDSDRYVVVKKGDLWLYIKGEGQGIRLTKDAGKDVLWQVAPENWSPDGRKLAATRVDHSNVHHLPIIDYTFPVETVDEVVYTKSGGGFPQMEMFVFDVVSQERVTVHTGPREDIYLFPIGWSGDGSELLFMRLTREAKRLDLMAADPKTGLSRVILTEKQETFVGGLDFITRGWRDWFTAIEETDRFLWLSERDGWSHLYLYSLDGMLIQRLTEGEFPVLKVAAVDREKGQVFFLANAEKRLYDTHLYRVDMKGRGFRRLTEGMGDHQAQISPSKRCFVDTHSSSIRPPRSELRSTEGEHLLTLEEADVSRLESMNWKPPEEFVVKADDGKTDLYGVLYKPGDFDPKKSYPVIDFIYAGPFITTVPNTYAPFSGLAVRAQAIAQLGFLTFIVDCRGTTERGKAFQDASYGRIGEIEIPDHVAALHQLAADRPYMDLTRVGIFGTSWGGYFALRGMLVAPDVFHVGIAAAPGDLTEAQPINEPYMGLPQNNRDGYAAGSNPALAGNLKGKLLIIHGTADRNAPFSTSMRMVEALVRAGKLHDLAVLPQADHYFRGPSGSYMALLMASYFKEHLLGG